MADQHDTVELECVEQAEDVARMVLDRVSGRRCIALATATHVQREHVAQVGEPRMHEPVEGVGVRRQAGDEHEHGAVAAVVEVVHPDPVRLDVAVAHDRASSLEYLSLSSRRSIFPAAFRGNSSSTTTLRELLEARVHPLVHPVPDLLRAGGLALTERHRGDRRLSPLSFRNPEHGDLCNCLMPGHDLLDVARVHVHAARDDEILLAVDEIQEPVLVDVPEIARVDPPLPDRLAR